MKYYINCHLAVAEEMSHQTVQVLSGAFMLLCIEAYEEFLLYAVITEEARGDLG